MSANSTTTAPPRRGDPLLATLAGSVTPIGFIELRDGRSRYVPTVHPARMVALFLAAAIATLLIVRPAPPEPRMRRFVRR